MIADPQIIDRHSYPGRGPLLSALSQYVVDLNLRKSWNSAFRHLRPHAVVVLGTLELFITLCWEPKNTPGDMMDNGRLSMPATEYVYQSYAPQSVPSGMN